MMIRVYMLLLILAAAMPYRFECSAGPFSTCSVLDVTLFFGLALLTVVIIKRGRFYLGEKRVFLCVALPIVFAVVSLLWTSDVDSTIKYLVKIGTPLIAYAVVVNLAHNFPERTIRQYYSLFFAYCTLGTLGFFLHVPGFQLLELKDTIDPNLIASAHMRLTNPFIGRAPDYGPILAFGAFAMLAYSLIFKQRYYTLMTIFLILCVILTFTRGILLGFLVSFFFFGFVLKVGFLTSVKKIAKVLVLLVPVLTISIGNYEFGVGDRTVKLSQVVFEDRTTTSNIESRFELYGVVLDKVMDSPFHGYGAGVFHLTDSRGEVIAAHNSYLQGLLFYGIIIGLFYILLLLYYFYSFWKMDVVSRDGKIMSVAMSAAILTILLSAVTQPFMEASVPRVLLAILTGLGVLSIKALEREYCLSRVNHVT